MIVIKREHLTENYIKEIVKEDNIIHWVVSKKDIKNNNYSKILKLLKFLSDVGIESKNKLSIGFYGYDNGTRGIYEGDEIWNYVRKLVNKCPYIFYFLTSYNDSLNLVFVSLFDRNDIHLISPTDATVKWSDDKMLEIVKPVFDYCRKINETPEYIEKLIFKMFNIHEKDFFRSLSVYRAMALSL